MNGEKKTVNHKSNFNKRSIRENQMKKKKCPECKKVLNSYNPGPYCHACVGDATLKDDRILEENRLEIVRLKAGLRILKNPKKLEKNIRRIENKIKRCEKARLKVQKMRGEK